MIDDVFAEQPSEYVFFYRNEFIGLLKQLRLLFPKPH